MTPEVGSWRANLGNERPTTIVVAVQSPDTTDAELDSSLAELERLAKTLGLEPVGRLTQRRKGLAPGLVLGEGKLKELARWTGGSGEVVAFERPNKSGAKMKAEAAAAAAADDDAATAAEAAAVAEAAAEAEAATAAESDTGSETESDIEAETEAATDSDAAFDPDAPPRARVVLVDHELTPTQQRNLEKATGVDVLDRTSVILEIFHRHAKTREARLQVEIARLRYLAPRLRESSGGGDRVRGGVGGKGAGETSLELDKRRIRDRIAELKNELSQIEGSSHIRRGRRSDLPTVALVGYTNAGKSSLMRALTGSEVYVADKLFATLDTTVRRLAPATEPPILVSDTVGFIKKLPHDLVASFRSTLDEAGEADLLLHVVDAADAAMADQLAVTREVLREIGVDQAPSWLLLNKIDRVDDAGRAALADHYPGALQLSAKSADDVVALRERLVAHFAGALEDAELDVPWSAQRLVHVIHERARILDEAHHETGTKLHVRAPVRVIAELRAALAEEVATAPDAAEPA